MSYRNLDNVRNLSPISVSEKVNLHSILSENYTDTASNYSDSYRRIVDQAKQLSRQSLSSKSKMTTLKGGKYSEASTIDKYGGYSSTSSAFMTEIMNDGKPMMGGSNDLSATSSAFMTEIMNDGKLMMGGSNDLSATSSAFMTEIMNDGKPMMGGSNDDFSSISSIVVSEIMNDGNPMMGGNNDDLSSISSIVVSEIMNGGARKKKASTPKKGAKKQGVDVEPKKVVEQKEDTTDSSSTLSSSDSLSDSDDDLSSSSTPVPKTQGGRYITGVRYLVSDTETQMTGGSNDSDDEDISETSFSTEDLTLFRN